jgi:hypothetical protein
MQDDLSVAADFLEEHGFADAASVLRAGGGLMRSLDQRVDLTLDIGSGTTQVEGLYLHGFRWNPDASLHLTLRERDPVSFAYSVSDAFIEEQRMRYENAPSA